MPAPLRGWRLNADRPVIDMQPGMRPAYYPAPLPARSADPGRRPDARHVSIPPRFWRTFAGQPEQVAQARHFVARALAGCPALADVVLLASELATNAVQHSATGRGGTFAVAIAHAPGRVRVTVTDDGAASRPVVATAGELSTSGRGLILVDGLASQWGYAGPGEHGQPLDGLPRTAVWFELACQ